METATVDATPERLGVGSKTIADLLPLAVRKYGSGRAVLHKEGENWVSKRDPSSTRAAPTSRS